MKRYILSVLLCLSAASQALATQPAGVFGPALIHNNPEYPNAQYTRSGYFTEYYGAPYNGYHMGEDWNDVVNGDWNHPLYALAKGRIVSIDNNTASDSISRAMKVRYKLPDNTEVDSVYFHLKEIESGLVVGSEVAKGQRIARVGDGNGFYSGNAHLHWEMRTDLNMLLRSNPYHGAQQVGGPARDPMTPANVLRYTSASLFVDDRSQTEPKPITSSGAWTFFYVNNYAPSSTAYLDVGDGDLYSINRAVTANLINSYGVIYQKSDGSWWFYNNVMDIYFEPGTQYAIWLNNGTGTFNVVPPANNYKDDRARNDMVRIANEDSRFNNPVAAKNNVRVELFASYNTSDPTYYYRQMAFMFTRADGTEGGAYFNHATLKVNPLIRYVNKYNIDTGTWAWVQMDRNSLY